MRFTDDTEEKKIIETSTLQQLEGNRSSHENIAELAWQNKQQQKKKMFELYKKNDQHENVMVYH